MKRFFLMMFLFLIIFSVNAQDVIVKRNGDEIESKVTKVSDAEIEYKKWTNMDGPTYTIKTSEVFMVKYQNGEKDLFRENPNKEGDTANKNQEPQKEIRHPDSSGVDSEVNRNRLAIWNKPAQIEVQEKYKDKKACLAYLTFGGTENSLLINKDVAIWFENDHVETVSPSLGKNIAIPMTAIVSKIQNLSNQTIYVDLGNSFIIYNNEATCYYSMQSTTVTSGSSNGVGVNLGAVANALGLGGIAGTLASGVNVGGSRSSGISTTTYSQRVIAVPPKSTYSFEPHFLFGRDETYLGNGMWFGKSPYHIGYVLSLGFPKNSDKGELMNGERILYQENNSPLRFTGMITYSFNENCEESNVMYGTMYLKEIIGRYDSQLKDVTALKATYAGNICLSIYLKTGKGVDAFPR